MSLRELHLNDAQQKIAPDGSLVYLLACIDEGGTAVFELAAGLIARPVMHPRVEEIWFVLSGKGQIWRHAETGAPRITNLHPGVSLNIPKRTRFQFRADGPEPLRILGVTAPPWNGDADAEILEHGKWRWTV